MELFKASATYIVPLTMTRSMGHWNLACVREPSTSPPWPWALPAYVLTYPFSVIFLITEFSESETYSELSAGLNTIEHGMSNCALEPGPSTYPCTPVPAKVVTFPDVSIFRITLLPASATYMLPFASHAAFAGAPNWALVL